jgi:hypothetical protein
MSSVFLSVITAAFLAFVVEEVSLKVPHKGGGATIINDKASDTKFGFILFKVGRKDLK